jgi:hypothetical protein
VADTAGLQTTRRRNRPGTPRHRCAPQPTDRDGVDRGQRSALHSLEPITEQRLAKCLLPWSRAQVSANVKLPGEMSICIAFLGLRRSIALTVLLARDPRQVGFPANLTQAICSGTSEARPNRDSRARSTSPSRDGYRAAHTGRHHGSRGRPGEFALRVP